MSTPLINPVWIWLLRIATALYCVWLFWDAIDYFRERRYVHSAIDFILSLTTFAMFVVSCTLF